MGVCNIVASKQLSWTGAVTGFVIVTSAIFEEGNERRKESSRELYWQMIEIKNNNSLDATILSARDSKRQMMML